MYNSPECHQLRSLLLQHRLALGISQSEAARRLGLYRSDYAGIENGGMKPVSVWRVIQLLRGLGAKVDVSVLISGSDTSTPIEGESPNG